MALRLHFKAHGKSNVEFSGEGTVVNMSSKGLLFSSETKLLSGEGISVLVDWPLPSRGSTQSLLILGHVVWCTSPRIAVSISRYEFTSKLTKKPRRLWQLRG